MNHFRIVLEPGERQVVSQVVHEVSELVASELGVTPPDPMDLTVSPSIEANPAGSRAGGTNTVSAQTGDADALGTANTDSHDVDSSNAAHANDFARWAQQLQDLDLDEDVHVSDDPALLRLFPPASNSDPEAAHEFRGLTQKGIADEKLSALASVMRDLDQPNDNEITIADLPSWLRCMTDCRLVLASRLGIVTKEDAESVDAIAFAEPDSPEFEAAILGMQGGDDPDNNSFERIRYTAQVYSFFGSLQESLLHVMRLDRD